MEADSVVVDSAEEAFAEEDSVGEALEEEAAPSGESTGESTGVESEEEADRPPRQTLLTVCEKGYGKRTDLSEYRVQGRNGSGIINIRTTERNGKVVGLKGVEDGDEIVLVTSRGLVMRMAVNGISIIGRATQGVRLIRLREGDRLVSVDRIIVEKEEEKGEESEGGEEVVRPEDPVEGQEEISGDIKDEGQTELPEGDAPPPGEVDGPVD